jgi:hypothetical protein
MGSAYVTAYDSRPILHVRPEQNRRFKPLTFVEAVCEDTKPTVEELLSAYRVAGDVFVGKMKRLFIILDDDVAVKQPAKAGNQKKQKNKRHASGDGTSSSNSNKKQPKVTVPATQ